MILYKGNKEKECDIMRYTVDVKGRQKTINIPDATIKEYEKCFELSTEDAIKMYLEEEGYLDNAELDELEEKAEKNKVSVRGEAKSKTERKKTNKPKVVKVSDTKKELFSKISQFLTDTFGENVEILKENKLIQVKIGEDMFKIDIIQQRKPK